MTSERNLDMTTGSGRTRTSKREFKTWHPGTKESISTRIDLKSSFYPACRLSKFLSHCAGFRRRSNGLGSRTSPSGRGAGAGVDSV